MALAAVFAVSAVMCCCVRHLVQEHASAKSSCCQGKSSKSDSSHTTCDSCSSITKSADVLAKVHFTSPSNGALNHSTFDLSPLTFELKTKLNSAFLNGPPGPVVTVALYTQFHSLRI